MQIEKFIKTYWLLLTIIIFFILFGTIQFQFNIENYNNRWSACPETQDCSKDGIVHKCNYDSIIAENREDSNQIQKLQGEYTEAQNELSNLQSTFDTLRTSDQMCKNALNTYKTSYDVMEKEIEDKNAEIEKYKKELINLERKKYDDVTVLNNLKKKIDSIGIKGLSPGEQKKRLAIIQPIINEINRLEHKISTPSGTLHVCEKTDHGPVILPGVLPKTITGGLAPTPSPISPIDVRPRPAPRPKVHKKVSMWTLIRKYGLKDMEKIKKAACKHKYWITDIAYKDDTAVEELAKQIGIPEFILMDMKSISKADITKVVDDICSHKLDDIWHMLKSFGLHELIKLKDYACKHRKELEGLAHKSEKELESIASLAGLPADLIFLLAGIVGKELDRLINFICTHSLADLGKDIEKEWDKFKHWF